MKQYYTRYNNPFQFASAYYSLIAKIHASCPPVRNIEHLVPKSGIIISTGLGTDWPNCIKFVSDKDEYFKIFWQNFERLECLPVFSHFEITTLKPFSKVLVREEPGQKWKCAILSHIEGVWTPTFHTENKEYAQCLPYDERTRLMPNTTEGALLLHSDGKIDNWNIYNKGW